VCTHVRPCSSPLGLPGVGKTTRANELASTHRVLRLTPDEWMAPLIRESEADGRRDVLEGRVIWVAHQVLLIRPRGSPDPRPRLRALGAALDRLGNAWSRRTLPLVRPPIPVSDSTHMPMSGWLHGERLACTRRRRRPDAGKRSGGRLSTDSNGGAPSVTTSGRAAAQQSPVVRGLTRGGPL
jgi:hypothetical protein